MVDRQEEHQSALIQDSRLPSDAQVDALQPAGTGVLVWPETQLGAQQDTDAARKTVVNTQWDIKTDGEVYVDRLGKRLLLYV